jgi:hypothetical protein
MPVYPGAQIIDSLFGREPELRKYGGPMTFFNKLLKDLREDGGIVPGRGT